MKNTTLPLSYVLLQSEDTLALGAELALLCPQSCVLFLEGALGAGKTTFSRGFIKQLAHGEKHVKSPTYTLLETYITPSGLILHFDLYRLRNTLELENIGIRDYTQHPAMWLVEWPWQANGAYLLPVPDILVNFTFISDYHKVTLTSQSPKGDVLVRKLQEKVLKNFTSL